MVNNMRFISKALIFSSSMLVLLSTTICAGKNNIKSATFISEKFEVGAGKVTNKNLGNIEFPRGHVGIKSFDVEIVDEQGNSVPSYEAYLHHAFVMRYHDPIHKDTTKSFNGSLFIRNNGTCETYILPYWWGLGVEARGTSTKLPGPYAVEIGNPKNIPYGYLEKWFFDIMIIDTRGTKDSKGCTECRCDHFNLPSNHLTETKGVYGKPLGPNYKGGIFCCVNNGQCTLKEGFQATNRTLALRYKVTWVDWEPQQIPVSFYVLDTTDRVRRNGSNLIHACQVEYEIPQSTSLNPSPHVQRANIPMEKGGYLIYGTAHIHTGGLGASIYGQDGKLLCTSKPKYGTGKEPGNEKGYLVGMSGCYPKPGSIKIKNGEIVTVESKYKSDFLTGAMGQMYIWLADELPKGRRGGGKVVKTKTKSKFPFKNHMPKNRSLQKNQMQQRKTSRKSKKTAKSSQPL